MIPILAALQDLYSQPETRDSLLQLIAADVNQDSRDDAGREGLDYCRRLAKNTARSAFPDGH